MAAEKRLIDANALHQGIAFAEFDTVQDRLFITEIIHNAPTVYAVEVVRCEDCYHYVMPDDGDFLGRCTSGILAVSNNGEIYPGRGFYCLYGERKKLCQK